MKKSVLLLMASLLLGTNVLAQDISYVVTDLDMQNFWAKTGKAQEKISMVTKNLMVKNKFAHRAPVIVVSNKQVNATTNTFDRRIEIYSGVLGVIDNDDELAFIIGHEMAHAAESYSGIMKFFIASGWNSKSYEYKADMKAIDYMVSAGYDPVSAIIIGNKLFGEPFWDWGQTHPKGSKRLLTMYKYIYKKYPQYLTSEKTKNAYYQNFEYTCEDEIKGFKHKENIRQQKQRKREAI